MIVSLLTAFLFFVPMHSYQRDDFETLAKILTSSDDVVFFGNSVVRTPSKCDLDRRSIVEMMTSPQVGRVIDASRGGMSIGMMLDLLEVSTSLGVQPALVVLPLNPHDNSFRDASNNAGLHSYIHLNFAELSGGQFPDDAAYPRSYDGRFYGEYRDFSAKEFFLEKKVMKCPENMGKDTDFIRYMYFRNFLSQALDKPDSSDFLRRVHALQKKGIKILVVLMPVNIEDIEALHGPEAGKKVREKTGKALEVLVDVDVLDLSFELGASNFSDRYCACGHLNHVGRAFVAKRVSEEKALLVMRKF